MTDGVPRIAAVLLAAGLGSRFRDQDPSAATKLAATFKGEPLVRHAAKAALASNARPLVVVTGHAASRIVEALAGLDANFIHNPAYETGLASSLAAGLRGAPEDCDGAVIVLGDMPLVSSAAIDRLIETFAQRPDCAAVVPTHLGVRGNPVLLSRRLFAQACALRGDQGAKRLLAEAGAAVVDCEMGPEVVFDVDHPGALQRP